MGVERYGESIQDVKGKQEEIYGVGGDFLVFVF